MAHVHWEIDRDQNGNMTFSFRVSHYALVMADLSDPLDRSILCSPAKGPADIAQSLEILLRAVERGIAADRMADPQQTITPKNNGTN